MIAAWPSFALIAAYELLMRQVRRSAEGDTRLQERLSDSQHSVGPAAALDRSGCPAAHGRDLQRQAWQWAQANRTADGSLPSGREIARQYGRHERRGRMVKRSGCASEFAIGSEPGLYLVGQQAAGSTMYR